MKNRDANLFSAGVDENKRARIGEGWTKIRGAQNIKGRKLKGAKIKWSKVDDRKEIACTMQVSESRVK